MKKSRFATERNTTTGFEKSTLTCHLTMQGRTVVRADSWNRSGAAEIWRATCSRPARCQRRGCYRRGARVVVMHVGESALVDLVSGAIVKLSGPAIVSEGGGGWTERGGKGGPPRRRWGIGRLNRRRDDGIWRSRRRGRGTCRCTGGGCQVHVGNVAVVTDRSAELS